jgi:penicillin-binding protein 2
MLNQKNPEILPNMARSFGYGAPTGVIGIPADEESAGIVPDPNWMQQNGKGTWSATDAANLGIGQGFFEGTPAQMAMATAAIANGGKRLRPYLVSTVKNAAGAVVQSYGPSQIGTLPVTAEHIGNVQTGMIAAVGDPSGTTYSVFKGFPVRLGGKTGSAESAQDAPHAVFTCYGPASPVAGPAVTPQIAVAALNTYAGHGADWAAGPLIKPIMQQFFNVH